ncbi:hypothetical protein BH11BAC7_BH11BAC7_31040 [soil metagenome]
MDHRTHQNHNQNKSRSNAHHVSENKLQGKTVELPAIQPQVKQFHQIHPTPDFSLVEELPNRGEMPLQRTIVVSYTEYAANANAGYNHKTKLKSYFTNFVKEDYEMALQYYDTTLAPPDADILADHTSVQTGIAAGTDLATTEAEMITLVNGINQVLTRVIAAHPAYNLENHESKYARTAAGAWDYHGAALVSWENTVAAHVNGTTNARIMNAGAPDAVQSVNFSDVRLLIPPALRALMLDIYYKSAAGGIIDSRSAGERAARSVTVDKPGAIRSWHEDSRGKLPASGYVAPHGMLPNNVPAAMAPLHNHYAATSGAGGGAGAGAAVAPSGFIEYTGTGIANDQHNSKIVFDYMNNHIYLTLSHYQYWGRNAGGHYDNMAQDAGNAAQTGAQTLHGAWVKVVMDI